MKRPKTLEQALVASEDQVQIAFMQWAELERHKGVSLASYIVHVPNGGDIGAKKGDKLRKMGVKSGYPDLMVDIAKGGYHGLRIELKRAKGGTTRQKQKERIAMLLDEDYCAVVCKGYNDAVMTIKSYMAGKLVLANKHLLNIEIGAVNHE